MDPWKNIARLSRHDREQLQSKKLHQFLQTYVYPFSPYYKKLFDRNKISPQDIRSLEDLKKIPFTSKADFLDTQTEKERFRSFILQPNARKMKQHWSRLKLAQLMVQKVLWGEETSTEKLAKEYKPHFITYTTGTTHTPVPFLYTDHDIQNLSLSGKRMVSLFLLGKDDRLLNMFPYAPHLAFWQVALGGLAANVLILNTGGGKVMGTGGNILALKKMQPSVIIGVPSYVYHVLRQAQEEGVSLNSVKKVVLGASRVDEPFKERLRSVLAGMGAKDVAVFGTYGFTESRMAWAECPTPAGVSSGYHTYPDKEIFEIIDPQTGEVKEEGEDGELVYTSLDSRGSALIRYRTGDFVKGGITYAPCPYCHRQVPRISSDITRISDIKDLNLSKIKGHLVNLNNFYRALSPFKEIKEWQLEIRKKNDDPYEIDELTLYLSVEEEIDRNTLEKNLKQCILVATEISPNTIKFISFSEIIKRLELETAAKEKRILDMRPE